MTFLVPYTESWYPPLNAIRLGKQNNHEDKLWSVIANTPHGKIPGNNTRLNCF